MFHASSHALIGHSSGQNHRDSEPEGGVGRPRPRSTWPHALRLPKNAPFLSTADPQANATSGLGLSRRMRGKATEVLVEGIPPPGSFSHEYPFLSSFPPHQSGRGGGGAGRDGRSGTPAPECARQGRRTLISSSLMSPVARPAHAECPHRSRFGAHPGAVRVLRARRTRSASLHRDDGAKTAQRGAGDRGGAAYHVRRPPATLEQIVDEVKKYFGEQGVSQGDSSRATVRLSEAPSFGKPSFSTTRCPREAGTTWRWRRGCW